MESPPLFASIQPNHLVDEVVVRMRRAILEGRLRPGEHLAETSIAQQFGVSRSPVREALQALGREGLVQNIPNRGSFVRDFTPQDVDEIFSLRIAVESLAAEWTIGQLTQMDMENLRALVAAQREAAEDGDVLRYNQADLDFHEYVCKRSGHSRLMEVWAGIRSQCLALFHRHVWVHPNYAPQPALGHHERLLEALERRDLPRLLALHRELNSRIAGQTKAELAQIAADGPH